MAKGGGMVASQVLGGRAADRYGKKMNLEGQVLTLGQILVIVLWHQRYSSGNIFSQK